ncbi:MAG: hypothetical protein HYV28_19625 [Ignavibacteriales bacterium]|nr:hypothetical protein [Ignavibacteriales bacterium]
MGKLGGLLNSHYVYRSTTKGKYTRILLRKNFRENGKVKHRTVGNLSSCTDVELKAIELALKHKQDLTVLGAIAGSTVSLQQGTSFGETWTVYQIAKQLGIGKVLGNTRDGNLVMWQVIARVLAQGSRLPTL